MKRITWSVVALVVALPATAAAAPTATDEKNAAKECKALRAAMGEENFRKEFGTNKNGRNAYGKCVSRKSREEAQERRAAKRNAAKECKAERDDPNFAATHGGKSFQEFYGTNKNGKNAYGKCVSRKAKEKKAEADAEDRNKVNAARECKEEQADSNFASSHDGKTFAQFYGTNANDKNAYGKCVSSKARAKNDEAEGTS